MGGGCTERVLSQKVVPRSVRRLTCVYTCGTLTMQDVTNLAFMRRRDGQDQLAFFWCVARKSSSVSQCAPSEPPETITLSCGREQVQRASNLCQGRSPRRSVELYPSPP